MPTEASPPRPPVSPNGQDHGHSPRVSWGMLLILGLMLAGMWLWRASRLETEYPAVDYSQMFEWLAAGKLKAVDLKGHVLRGALKKPEKLGDRSIATFQTNLPAGDTAVLPLLRDFKVDIRVESESQPFAVELVLNLLPWVLIIGAWVWMSRRARRLMAAGGGALGAILPSRSRRFDKASQVGVTFDDVAGLKAAKRDLQEIVLFLKEPERFRRLGGKVPRGVLLVGPPGTGKTLLARAVAGESGVPFFSISASEFIELYVGLGAARVRDLFGEAKKSAPAIIFIDEIDAIGRSRGTGLGGGHDEREQTLNQLLAEMDGFTRNDLTVVMAATNRPDVLDPALLRPGRFDRRVLVDRPELQARRAILEVHTKGKPLAPDVDLLAVARATPGFSGADLANLVNEAALGATRRGADAIARVDFTAAYDKIVLGDPRDAKLDPVEKSRVAVHESGHAIVAQYSPDTEPLQRVTIIPRGIALGLTQQELLDDRHLAAKPQLEARLRVLMGGLAAEKARLGNISTGAENDLKEATRLAMKMVAHYGMSDKLGPVYIAHEEEHAFLGQRIATDAGTSDATLNAVELETRRLLGQALDEASGIITGHPEVMERLVATLIEKETLDKDELVAFFGRNERGTPAAQAAEGAP